MSRALLAMVLVLVGPACKRQDGAPLPAASAAPAVPSAPSAAAPPAVALSGLDPCVVGKWKTTKVALKVDQLNAEGGAGMAMQIAPGGATTIDFDRMSDIHATSPSVNFDFRYSGKVTGVVKTPAAGTIAGDGTELSGLRVTANVKLPGAGSMPLFKDTPVAELAKMGEAAAKGAPGAAKTPQGIQASPVFSSNRYSCSPESLTLHGGELDVSWSFRREP